MSNSAAAASSSDEQNDTGLLALPAELRNKIYEFVFAIDTAGQVELLDAGPPSKELILASRQLCGETRLLHQAAYRNFWRETNFTITLEYGGHHMFVNRALRGLRTEDVENIRSLRIITSSSAAYSLGEGVWIGMGAGRFDRLLAPASFRSVLLDAGYRERGSIPERGATGRLTFFWPSDPAAAKKLLKGRSITREEIMLLTKDSNHRSWPESS